MNELKQHYKEAQQAKKDFYNNLKSKVGLSGKSFKELAVYIAKNKKIFRGKKKKLSPDSVIAQLKAVSIDEEAMDLIEEFFKEN